MVWSAAHDEMLRREILVIDPFTGTRKSTVARGTKWEEVAENLNKIKQIYFKVDKRAVRDRYNLLSKELRKKKQSGVETVMTEVEMALEELIEKENAAETEQRVVDNQKKAKDSQGRENAEKFSSYSKINSSSIEPSLYLSKRRFLASLKDVIAVVQRKLSAPPSCTKMHILKFFAFGGHDGTRPSPTLPVPSPS